MGTFPILRRQMNIIYEEKPRSSPASDLVDVLERKTERFVSRSLRGVDVVKSVHDGHSGVVLLVCFLDAPCLEPRHLGTGLQHVVAIPSGDWNERNRIRIISDLLNVRRDFLSDFVEPILFEKC